MGFTGINCLIGDKLGIALVVRANMPIGDGGFPYTNRIWLLYARDVPCGIAIFSSHYHVSPSALPMLSVQSQVQTYPFLA